MPIGGGDASFLEVGEDGSFANVVAGSSIGGCDASFLKVGEDGSFANAVITGSLVDGDGWFLTVVERLFLLPFFIMDRWRRR